MVVKPILPDNKGGKKDNTTLIISGIPEVLKTRFKLLCVQQGMSMSRVLVEVMKQLTNEKK